MNLNNDFLNKQLNIDNLVRAKPIGMVDTSYIDGSRNKACDEFLKKLETFMVTGGPQYKSIINTDDILFSNSVLLNVRNVCPEKEAILLFWCDRTNYDDKGDYFQIFYPVTDTGSRDAATSYMVAKSDYNIFFFNEMYTENYNNLAYSRMTYMKIMMPYVSPPPPPVVSIKNDGQMKILTDVIEMVQDINFEDGDKILVLGSASEGGVCSGRSYNIISHMVDKKIEVELYDPCDVTMEYQIGTVLYKHYKKKYVYDGSESRYKLLFDDVWDKGRHRIWDRRNYYAKAQFYSIKWFPFYDESLRVKKSRIKMQRYFTKGCEQRLVSHMPEIRYRSEDRLGSCRKCHWLKFVLHNEYSIEFYDYVLKMHLLHCVTKEKRTFFSELTETLDQKWFEVTHMELPVDKWSCVAWDIVEGFPIVFVSDISVSSLRLIFTDRRNVRPDMYKDSIIYLRQLNGRCYTNKEKIEDLIYGTYVMSDDINRLVQKFQFSQKKAKKIKPVKVEKNQIYIEPSKKALRKIRDEG